MSGVLFKDIVDIKDIDPEGKKFDRDDKIRIEGFVFPHGAITLDPETRDFSGIPAVTNTSKAECIKLHHAMRFNAALLVDSRPDLIILSTPHGLKLQNSFLFLGNSKTNGSAQWNGDWMNFTAGFDIDVENSKNLANNLREAGNSVELLNLGSESDPLPLRWGEVIPWWFINQAAQNVGFQLPPVIFIGQPKRYHSSQQTIPELLKFGGDIFQWIKSDRNISEKKIAMVVSSDLSHYHSADSTSPYPYSEFATVFDGYVDEWATIDRLPENESESYDKLITKAGNLMDRIGSCGYTGLVTLHGLLSEAVKAGLKFQARRIQYSAPTYYGMMVNHFEPVN